MPYPPFQPAILYSADAGGREFKGLSLRVEKRYSAGLFFLGNYQLSKRIATTVPAKSKRTTRRLPGTSTPTRASRYDQRHRGAFSSGYELPFGTGTAMAVSGGVVAYVLGGWQVQGVIRAGSGFPYRYVRTNVCQCGSFVPQRVNYAPGREGDAGNSTIRR